MTSDGWPTFPDGPRAQRLHSMVLTRYFALIHVPRTGGQFIRKVTFEGLPGDWFIRNALDAHTPYDVVAEDFGSLPMFCCVRNPWDWYVSWYHFVTQTEPGSGPMWKTAFDSGRNDFRTTIRSACAAEAFENPRTGPIMEALDVDHYTAVFKRMVGEGVERGRIEVLRFESLQEDFLAFLERHDVPVERSFADKLRAEPAYGSSRRGPYAEYYDDELRELVRHKARLMIEPYGYEF